VEPEQTPETGTWSGWQDAAEAGAVLLVGGAATVGLRYLLSSIFPATSLTALVDPALAPSLRLADFPWPDCIALLIGMIVLPVLYERCLRGTSLSEIGFRCGNRAYLLVNGGLAAGMGMMLWAMFVCRALHLQYPRLTDPTNRGNVALFALTWLVVAGSEEVFFRGIVQRRLAGAAGPATAIVAVAGVFAFAGHPHAEPVVSLAIRLPGGILFGYLYHRTKSLVPSFAGHWAFNLLIGLGP
jgi:membrane protease YdiL (CAAX protease family)